jgi:hypothetical protein
MKAAVRFGRLTCSIHLPCGGTEILGSRKEFPPASSRRLVFEGSHRSNHSNSRHAEVCEVEMNIP